ncbi:hypothetical protein ABKN59_010535 [Abortiporus biennis]
MRGSWRELPLAKERRVSVYDAEGCREIYPPRGVLLNARCLTLIASTQTSIWHNSSHHMSSEVIRKCNSTLWKLHTYTELEPNADPEFTELGELDDSRRGSFLAGIWLI